MSSTGTPRPPFLPNFQVLPVPQVGRSETSGARRPVGQIQGWPTNNWLDPVGIQAASEGLLLLKVAGSLTPSRYGGASKEGESILLLPLILRFLL